MAKGGGNAGRGGGGRVRVGDTIDPFGRREFRSRVVGTTRFGNQSGFLVRPLGARPGTLADRETFVPRNQAIRVGS